MKNQLNVFKNKKILIAGGLGFIGSNLARKLIELEANVQIIDSLIPEGGGNFFNVAGIEHKTDIQIADVRNETQMRTLAEGLDYLFNLAGQTSHLYSMKDPYADLELNGRAQLSILEASRKSGSRPKIIFASTRQIYGRPQVLPVTETHPLNPIDINGVHKLAAERYHQIYGETYGIRFCILRLTNTYGPRMRIRDSRQTFLGHWIHEILNGNEFPIFGDGRQFRDFTFVEDVVEALLLTAARCEADGEIFNLGGDQMTLEELARLLVDLNQSGSYRFVPFPEDLKAIDIGNYCADTSKIQSALGWSAKTNLKEGLLQTLHFFKSNLQPYQAEQKIDAAL